MTKSKKPSFGDVAEAINKVEVSLAEQYPEPTPGTERAATTIAAIQSDMPKRRLQELAEQRLLQERQGDDPLLDASDMLITQAQTMDKLFHLYAGLAQRNIARDTVSSLTTAERCMGLALRCQKQSANTIKALADIKNPKRAIFIKRQQNLLQLEQAKMQQQLGESDSAKVDTRSQRSPKTESIEAEAVAI